MQTITTSYVRVVPFLRRLVMTKNALRRVCCCTIPCAVWYRFRLRKCCPSCHHTACLGDFMRALRAARQQCMHYVRLILRMLVPLPSFKPDSLNFSCHVVAVRLILYCA